MARMKMTITDKKDGVELEFGGGADGKELAVFLCAAARAAILFANENLQILAKKSKAPQTATAAFYAMLLNVVGGTMEACREHVDTTDEVLEAVMAAREAYERGE